MLTRTFYGRRSVDGGSSQLKFSIVEIVEMGNNGGIGVLEYRLQFSCGSFRIDLDSALQFVVFDGGWSFTALIFLEARISCREAIEPAVDCPTGSIALTVCVVDVRGRSARIVVLAPLVVDDCSKWGFTYNNRKSSNPWARALIYPCGDSFENILQGSHTY